MFPPEKVGKMRGELVIAYDRVRIRDGKRRENYPKIMYAVRFSWWASLFRQL